MTPEEEKAQAEEEARAKAASEAAAELARAKAKAEAETKASRPLTMADFADLERAIREDIRKERTGTVAPTKKGAAWVAPVVAGVLVIGGLVFAFLRARRRTAA